MIQLEDNCGIKEEKSIYKDTLDHLLSYIISSPKWSKNYNHSPKPVLLNEQENVLPDHQQTASTGILYCLRLNTVAQLHTIATNNIN